jgi:large subunit ribosomal protein L10
MPLTKAQKAVALDEITAKIDETPALYFTNYSGLTVEQVSELRRRFREANVEFKVLKNTLVRLSMERLGGYEDMFEHLHGPTAIAFSEEPAAPARVLKDFLKDQNLEIPEFKGAYVDGAVFGAGSLEALSSLKSKDELIGDVIGLLLSPMTNVVGALQAQGSNLVGAIKTIAEREEA